MQYTVKPELMTSSEIRPGPGTPFGIVMLKKSLNNHYLVKQLQLWGPECGRCKHV